MRATAPSAVVAGESVQRPGHFLKIWPSRSNPGNEQRRRRISSATLTKQLPCHSPAIDAPTPKYCIYRTLRKHTRTCPPTAGSGACHLRPPTLTTWPTTPIGHGMGESTFAQRLSPAQTTLRPPPLVAVPRQPDYRFRRACRACLPSLNPASPPFARSCAINSRPGRTYDARSGACSAPCGPIDAP